MRLPAAIAKRIHRGEMTVAEAARLGDDGRVLPAASAAIRQAAAGAGRAYVVGKGPSLDRLDLADFGDPAAPIVAVNESIHAVEALGLPNPLFCVQQDASLGAACRPERAVWLLSRQAWETAGGDSYERAVRYDPKEVGGTSKSLSANQAIRYLARAGIRHLTMVAFDGAVGGATAYAEAIGHDPKGDPERFRRFRREMEKAAKYDRVSLDWVPPKPDWTVACVLRSGGQYRAEHVEYIRRQVAVMVRTAHRFVCLSDVRDVPGRVALRHDWPGWWAKCELFRPGLFAAGSGVLFLDLDTVIANPIELPNVDGMPEFWAQRDPKFASELQTSCMVWRAGAGARVYAEFVGNEAAAIASCRNDQPWMTARLPGPGPAVLKWASFKRDHLEQRGPGDAQVVQFHGKPKPWDVTLPWVPRLKPADTRLAAWERDTAVVVAAWGGGPRVEVTRRAMASWSAQSLACHVVLVEGVEPGCESRYRDVLPVGRSTHVIRTLRDEHGALMQKEAMWNLGAASAPKEARVLIFIDSDVRSDDLDWWTKIRYRFEAIKTDRLLVHGYRWMRETDPRGRSKWGYGTRVDPRCDRKGINNQPGLCWATTRRYLDDVGGWNPFCISGSGDVLALTELLPEGVHSHAKLYRKMAWWQGIERKGLPSALLTYADADVLHEWHGPQGDRAYFISREAIDWAETPVAELVRVGQDGLLAWRNPQCRLRRLLADKPALARDAEARRLEVGFLRHTYRGTFHGWFDFQDWYREIVREAPDGGEIVEIGAFLGASAAFLAVEMHNSGKRLHATSIDTFPVFDADQWRPAGRWPLPCGGRTEAQCRAAVAVTGAGELVTIRAANQCDVVDEWTDGAVWAVWLDADHSYVATLRALNAWWPKVATGGYLGCHDYDNGTHNQVKAAADAFAVAHGIMWRVSGRSCCVRKGVGS